MEWLVFFTMLVYNGLQGTLIWAIKSAQERERQEARRPRRTAIPGIGWPGGHHPMGVTDRIVSMNDLTRDQLNILDRELVALMKRRREKPEKVDWKNEGF